MEPPQGLMRVARHLLDADLAHLVERDLAKVEVAGSSPVIRSNKTRKYAFAYFFCFIYKFYEGLEQGGSE